MWWDPLGPQGFPKSAKLEGGPEVPLDNVVHSVFTGAIGLMALAARSTPHPVWWIVASGLISLGLVVATYIQVAREEGNRRSTG
jgi:hypothetical protein